MSAIFMYISFFLFLENKIYVIKFLILKYGVGKVRNQMQKWKVKNEQGEKFRKNIEIKINLD